MRKQFNDLLIGANGSGKTYMQIKIAIAYAKQNPLKRVLFNLADDGEKKLWNIDEIDKEELVSFRGIKKFIIDTHKDFEFIADTFRSYKDEKTGERIQREFNGLMCCDDLGGAMNRRPTEAINFLKKRRQPNIDFLWAFHGLRTDVPPAFYTYVNRIILFNTSDNHEETMKHLRSDKQQEFEDVYNHVQKEAKKNPHYCAQIVINPLDI